MHVPPVVGQPPPPPSRPSRLRLAGFRMEAHKVNECRELPPKPEPPKKKWTWPWKPKPETKNPA